MLSFIFAQFSGESQPFHGMRPFLFLATTFRNWEFTLGFQGCGSDEFELQHHGFQGIGVRET